MAQRIDILIIGGPPVAELATIKSVRHVPNDISGLAEAYRLIPEVATVIWFPGYFKEWGGPRQACADDFKTFVSQDGTNPVLDILSSLETANNVASVQKDDDIIAKILQLPDEIQNVFLERSYLTIIDITSSRLEVIASSGARVFQLYTEPEFLKTGIKQLAFHIDDVELSIEYDDTWSARVQGKFAWLLEDVRPKVWFCNYDTFFIKMCQKLAPDPRYPEIVRRTIAGAEDREGKIRVVMLPMGKGEMILTSSLAFGNLVKKILHNDLDGLLSATDMNDTINTKSPIDSAVSEILIREIRLFLESTFTRSIPSQTNGPYSTNQQPLTPGWRRGRLILQRLPNGSTPALFQVCNKTYTVPSGKAWSVVQRLISADAFDKHGIPLSRPGDHFKKKHHREFFNDLMTKNSSGWYIKTD
jgi:hypothetical protein